MESADSELSQVEQRRNGAFIEERSLIIACFGAQHASVFEACGARTRAGSAFSRMLLRPGFAAQDGALPVGRAAAGGACRNVDGLRELCQVTNDALGFGDQGESFMRPLQLGHCSTSISNVLFRSSAHPR